MKKEIEVIRKVESFIGNEVYVVEDRTGKYLLALSMIPILGTLIILLYFILRSKKYYTK